MYVSYGDLMKLKAASMLNRHSKYNICNMD